MPLCSQKIADNMNCNVTGDCTYHIGVWTVNFYSSKYSIKVPTNEIHSVYMKLLCIYPKPIKQLEIKQINQILKISSAKSFYVPHRKNQTIVMYVVFELKFFLIVILSAS